MRCLQNSLGLLSQANLSKQPRRGGFCGGPDAYFRRFTGHSESIFDGQTAFVYGFLGHFGPTDSLDGQSQKLELVGEKSQRLCSSVHRFLARGRNPCGAGGVRLVIYYLIFFILISTTNPASRLPTLRSRTTAG